MKCVVCNGIIEKRPCIIPNVGCAGRFYNVAVTYEIPKYPYALLHTVCGDHNFLMRIAANQV